MIDEMYISQQNQDVQGDLYEYMLEKLNQSGRISSPMGHHPLVGMDSSPTAQQEQLPYGYDVAAVVRHSAFEPRRLSLEE